MFNRNFVKFGLAALMCIGTAMSANATVTKYNFTSEHAKKATYKGKRVVSFRSDYTPGTIIVRTDHRKLYYIVDNKTVIEYGIGVGRKGFEWSGIESVTRKAEWPDWTPPAEMRERQPDIPEFMPGGPDNPLGARALYLGSTLYRIHGTAEPHTIGQAVSSGCIRMLNDDVIDLYQRVKVGAKVYVF